MRDAENGLARFRSIWMLAVSLLLLAGCSASSTKDGVTTVQNVNRPNAEISQASDWPRFLGPLSTSVSLEKGLISPWPKDGPKILWKRKLGIGYAMPSISRGKLYHFERVDNTARLICCEADTGKELWTFAYPTDYRDKYNYNGGPRCCPVIDGNFVYLHGVEGMLHCVTADKGEVVWKVDTVKEFGVVQNFFGVGATPIVEGDLLIAIVGGSPPGSDDIDDFMKLPGNGTGLVAFEKATGKVRWKLSDELAGYASPTVVTIDGKRTGLAFMRGGLLAFEPQTGKQHFHFPWRAPILESVNAANPVVVGDRILITETYGLGGVLLQWPGHGEPKEIWSDLKKPPRAKSMMAHWMTPIEKDGYIYGSSGRHESNAELRCIDLATGKVQWSEPYLTRTSLLMVDDHFICLGEDGVLRLLRVNPKKYDVVSEVELRDPATNLPLLREPCWAAPILCNGRLYVRGEGRLVCLEAMRPR
jgi:outer membrane protein assembly factor BamB